MRNVTELSKMKGRVVVYLKDSVIGRKFMRDAEEEGFTFGDSIKPTSNPLDSVIAVNRDWTLNYVGYIGHLAFFEGADEPDTGWIRIDYEKYILGEEDYFYVREKPKYSQKYQG